jgi:hypothetical protein
MEFLCTKEEQALAIGQTLSNMYKTYYQKKDKNRKKHLEVIDKGSYLVKHNITNKELEFMVDVILKHKQMFKRIRRCKKTQ